MITELEETSFTDGFMVALLEAWRANDGRVSFQAKLFDGGRRVHHVRFRAGVDDIEPAMSALLKLLYRVVAEPGVCTVFGSGHTEILRRLRPELLTHLRRLDLRTMAVALDPGLKARSKTAELAAAYGLEHSTDEPILYSTTVEELMWAVIRRAGQRGMSWRDLFDVVQSSRSAPDYSRCEFDAATLSALPPVPAVYLMKGRHGEVLYVGKAANLNRRIGDYYNAKSDLPEKVKSLRSTVTSLDYCSVGSELEALLLEQRLITEHAPPVNVQKQVAEGRSRYGRPLFPVLVVERSTRADAVELFFMSEDQRLVQMRMTPSRPARASIRRLTAAFAGSDKLRKTRSMTAWGRGEAEIGWRYFMRAKDHLHWTEINTSLSDDRIIEIGRIILREEPMTGEFRS